MNPPARPLRILHAPVNIANQAGYVADALRRMGHTVEVWDTASRFGFPADRVIDAEGRTPADAWATFLDALDRFDIIHCHFRNSLLGPVPAGLPPYWDLPVFRALGRKVFFTFHGTDVRTRRIHEQINPWSLYQYAEVPAEDDRTEKAIQVIRTYANGMFVGSVNLLHFVPDAVYLPRAIDLAAWPDLAAPAHARPVILHVASSPLTKGSPIIRQDLQGLAEEGLDFDLRVLEGVSHAEVRAALAEADILIDNVIAGTYGVSSMEAMACGRVAVANLSAEVRATHPDCPVLAVDPTTFVGEMRRLLTTPGEIVRRAARGRPYVARVHDAPVIAARLVEAYRAPARPLPRAAMPDWMSAHGQRRIEILEERVARLQVEVGQARLREEALRRRLDLPVRSRSARLRAAARRIVPPAIRARLRRPPAR